MVIFFLNHFFCLFPLSLRFALAACRSSPFDEILDALIPPPFPRLGPRYLMTSLSQASLVTSPPHLRPASSLSPPPPRPPFFPYPLLLSIRFPFLSPDHPSFRLITGRVICLRLDVICDMGEGRPIMFVSSF